MKIPHTIRKNLLRIFIMLIFTSGITYAGLRIWFRLEINQVCQKAMQEYEGDKIEALISVLNSDHQNLNTKNKVIWALGKLRDKRSLPTLKKLQTGAECDHNHYVCQRELEWAIANLEGRRIDILTFK